MGNGSDTKVVRVILVNKAKWMEKQNHRYPWYTATLNAKGDWVSFDSHAFRSSAIQEAARKARHHGVEWTDETSGDGSLKAPKP